MIIAVLGSGGREHAIAWALAKSPRCEKLYVLPGNGGTAAIAENVEGVDIDNGEEVLAFVRAHAVDLVVIGPEAPLVAGVADTLRAAGVLVFGPDAQGIPTAAYGTFTEAAPAVQYVRDMGAPIVVKADGLAAGKGVIVAQTVEEAVDAVNDCFEGAFGKAGSRVVVEECLTGPECSLLAFVTGGHAFCMATAQDHKRAYDGDEGPNTGGMGVYSPVPIVTDDELAAMTEVMETAAAASRKKYQVLRVNLSFIAFLPPGAACSGPAEFFKELKIL